MKKSVQLVVAIIANYFFVFPSTGMESPEVTSEISDYGVAEVTKEEISADVDTSSSSAKSVKAAGRIYLPSTTFDTSFRLIFEQKKFLKAFLNKVYGYNSEYRIEGLEYLPAKTEGIENSGNMVPDIRCLCKLNREDENGDIEFILEMQRHRQSSYVDRNLLETGRILSDEFTTSLSESKSQSASIPKRRKNLSSTVEKKKSPSENHNQKFQKHIKTIRHFSILRESFNKEWGWKYHIAPIVVNGELNNGNLRPTTIKPPTKTGYKVATNKQLYTFIQLDAYVEKMKEQGVMEGKDQKMKDWLNILALDFQEKAKTTKTGIALYEVPDVKDQVVKEVIEFVQTKMEKPENISLLAKDLAKEAEEIEVREKLARKKEKNKQLKVQTAELKAQVEKVEAQAEEFKVLAEKEKARAEEFKVLAEKEKAQAEEAKRESAMRLFEMGFV